MDPTSVVAPNTILIISEILAADSTSWGLEPGFISMPAMISIMSRAVSSPAVGVGDRLASE